MNETTGATPRQHTPTKNAAQQLREHLGAYLRPAAAAEYAGIGLSSLWRYLANREKTGFPAPIKPRGTRVTLFKRADLEAWVESRNTEGGAA